MRPWLAALTILALPAAAAAQPVTGLYVGGGAGVNLLQNEYRTLPNGYGFNRTTRFDDGFAGEVSVGWGFGNGLRAEIEGDYAYNHIRAASGAAVPLRAGGYQQQYGGFANVLYDLPLRLPIIARPYVGLGAGGRFVEEDGYNSSTAGYVFPYRGGSEARSAFAYQAIAGFAVPLPVPGLSFTTEYRFIGLLDPFPAFRGNLYTPNGVVTGNAHVSNVYNHEILIGLRYEFGGLRPPPPPPVVYRPPAPQAATRTYLVFFDWDRADLTGRAREIVASAARAAENTATVRIEVNGYTDLSGTADYNQALSVRRAKAVEAALIADGVPQVAIAIHGYGETHPLVPTAAGVREPQNRRVEIILR